MENSQTDIEIAQPRWQRARRKQAGVASVHYLRFEDQFILLATHGQHKFFDSHSPEQIQDCRRTGIKFGGYSMRRNAASEHGKWHTLVRLDKPTYCRAAAPICWTWRCEEIKEHWRRNFAASAFSRTGRYGNNCWPPCGPSIEDARPPAYQPSTIAAFGADGGLPSHLVSQSPTTQSIRASIQAWPQPCRPIRAGCGLVRRRATRVAAKHRHGGRRPRPVEPARPFRGRSRPRNRSRRKFVVVRLAAT